MELYVLWSYAFYKQYTIIGVTFDRDNLTLEFFKNGVSQGQLKNISGLDYSETYFLICGDSGGHHSLKLE